MTTNTPDTPRRRGLAALGLLLSALVGMLAGYWPARSASDLPVVDALRSE